MADGALTIVTGASQNHAQPLFHLLESLDRYEPGTRILVYDLGLAPRSLERLERQRRTVVRFRYEEHPPHVRRETIRNYAWKPALVHEVMQREGLPVLWLDAGNLVHERLRGVRAELARVGFYSPYTMRTIGEWCHPLARAAIGIEPDVLGAQNRNAAVIGFGDCPLARELIVAWYEHAMRPEVLCPPGSTTRNHRFDQTILSVLLTRAIQRHRLTATGQRLGISVHNDHLSRGDARHYMRCDATMTKDAALRASTFERQWWAMQCAWRRLRQSVAGG